MGKKLGNSIKRMSWQAKAGLVTLFTLLLTVGMYQGWYGILTSEAAPVGGNAWTSVYANQAYPNNSNYTLTIPSGQNRLLVVAIGTTRTTAGAVTIATPTFGTRPMTLAAGDAGSTTTWNHSALYYLTEADLAAASNSTLNLTISGGTAYYNYVYYRVYTGVDQSAPITAARNYNSNSTSSSSVGPFNPTLTVGANDQAIEIVNLARNASGTTAPSISTWATGWTTAGVAPTARTTSGPTARLYIRDRAVPTAVTNDGSTHTASTASSWKSMTAMSLKAAPASTSLTVSNNTAIATGSKLDSDEGVLMQRIQVTGSGQLELNSLTMNNTGTATTIGAAEIYISSSSQTTLPADAVLLGSATNWGGASTQISLTGGTQTNRTLGGTQPLTKYLYIVYDMSIGQAGSTVGSRVTAVGVASPNTGATGLSLSSNTLTLTRSGNLLSVTGNIPGRTTAKDSDAAVVMQHFQVDCDAAFDNALQIDSVTIEDLGTAALVDSVKVYISSVEEADATVLPASAKLIGAIGEWNKTSTVIDFNEHDPGTTADRTVIANGTLNGGPKYIYIVYSMHYDDVFVAGKTVQSKVTAVGVASPDGGANNLSLLSNTITLTRGTWSKITSCGGCHDTANIQDGTARNVPDGKFIGSHNKHTNALAMDCIVCHAKPPINKFNHADGFINLTGAVGKGYSKTKKFQVSNNPTMGTCSGLYCHSNGTSVATGNVQPIQTPAWGGSTNCSSCHAFPPAYTSGTPKANTHSASGHNIGCDRCHYSVTTNGTSVTNGANHGNNAYDVSPNTGAGISFTYTFAPSGGTCSSNACHGNVAWGGSLGCIECHNKTITRTKGRPGTTLANVSAEFGLAWGHKKAGRGAVTSADCIVCHLEGVSSTGRTSSYHQNGNIDLRDPDGTGEAQIKDVSGVNAFAFARFSTSYAAGTRTSTGHNSNTDIANVITQKFCLACHDADGATNTTARSGANATQYMPWNGVQLGANYTATNGATGTQGLVNVKSQVATTNSSKHPVLGPLNRDYPTAARLQVPYKPTGSRGTSGTLSQGVVINCFDCHNIPGNSPLTKRTVTAHGNANTVRGVPAVFGTASVSNQASLCLICHLGYDTVSTYDHGTGSAAGTSGTFDRSEKSAYIKWGCNLCHSSTYTSTATAVRPVRAMDVHGSNVVPTGQVAKRSGSRWASGGGPIAFIRNSDQFSTHNPRRIGTTTYTPECMGGSSGKFSACNRSSVENYAPGGTF
ncbi:CxxxxCH/CxxCH domain-containing protein [Geobacter sp. DSM 9736]|uniref:CxxxxCH/CxxCH domain c-type cytochrome n=1 Tax=Geobacter sp. DSM 9736 TaxID=1277350 RepID=UPI000B50D435|nr:CxxxxCH/CxxCH domain-containing protein [Geobacter sp. DSM 9736]SNB47900.1 Geobacter sulfurreducens CxxxxCH...CXXCH domain-containing protein [Geobacter sp. DSM 9736]